VNLDKVVPFALQTRLEALGGRYQAAEDFQPFVIQDGRLITGQNPASAVEVARLVMREVTEARKQRLAGGR
jgi:putative intracellular protease/amidase